MIRPVQTALYAVIGNPVKHSLSPAMMNAVFKSLGISAVYVALEVDALAEDLEKLAAVGFRGLSVTLPHKEAAFRLADEVDGTASAIGAVNTLKLHRGRWEGRNTDWIGSNRALELVAPLKGKRALVMGAGGVARAVVYGLSREGAQVTVCNRTAERGEALARAFQCNFIPLDEINRLAGEHGFEIVVQCTSVGLSGSRASPLIRSSFFREGMTVMDTVYRPFWTPFLRSAREAGCKVVHGLEMLLHQGVAQLEWWIEKKIPQAAGVQVMRDTLMRAVADEEDRQEN